MNAPICFAVKTPRRTDLAALEIVTSFYQDADGVTTADVADELHVTQPTAARRVSRLRSAGLVLPPGPRPLVARHEVKRMRATDAAVWGVICDPRGIDERLTRRSILERLGTTIHHTEAAILRLRAAGLISLDGWLFPSAAGLWLIANPTGETRPGVLSLRARRNPLWWRPADSLSMLIGLAVAREVDGSGCVVVPELAERLRVSEVEITDVVADMVRERFMEARVP
jgi:hypothetical protein